jgi:hydrogenase maturation factor
MCLSTVGRVIEVAPDAAEARVRCADRDRMAMTWLTPDITPGDWVELGAGTILRRLTQAEAYDLMALTAPGGVP